MSFSLVPAGSPAVPRVAATWVRAHAVPAIGVAIADVGAARDRAALGLVGASGGAYSLHVDSLLAHLGRLRDRLLGAAVLFESYADRLAAHEATLAGVRTRAIAAGLEVLGDTVLPPTGLLESVAWSDLASAVLGEHRALASWVATELDAVVPAYSDPDLTRWVADFLDANRVGLAASGLELVATRGGAGLAARELLEGAARMDQLARIPGPATVVHDSVVALESDTPAEGLCLVAGGTALAALAPVLVAGAPALVVAGTAVVLGYAGTKVAQQAWDRLPEPVQDALDEAVEDTWDGTKDLAEDVAEDAWDWADETVDDLGESVLTWVRS